MPNVTLQALNGLIIANLLALIILTLALCSLHSSPSSLWYLHPSLQVFLHVLIALPSPLHLDNTYSVQAYLSQNPNQV